MLIVTDQAEARAQQMLEQIAVDPAGWRCLYLKPMTELSLSEGQIRTLANTFQEFLRGLPGGVFFSGTGHTWAIYKNELSPAQAALLLSTLRGHFAPDQLEGISHYDLKTNLHQVLGKIERLQLPNAVPAPRPGLQIQSGNVMERMAAFLGNIPPGTVSELANQRAKRNETVVLTVEDDPFYSRMIEKVLSPHARVIVADSADKVMEEYILSAPDIVLMDIGLPEVSGHQLLKGLLT
jgi:CheY-like chemotaxis protein